MFEHLFTPITIKPNFTVKNRILMAPMMTNFASSAGNVTDRLINYYVERSIGGAGLIFIENACVHIDGPMLGNMLQVSENTCLDALSRLAEAVKRENAKVILQLSHGGARTPVAATGKTAVAPSAIAPPNYATPRELTLKEIANLIDAFGKAAQRAKAAGFDGIDLHMASGYLISQFLSPYTNQRNDDFGGDWRRRARFSLEVLKKCREYVGREYPIFCKLNASDYLEGGLEVDDSIATAQLLQENGIDAFTISGGMYESIWASTPGEHLPQGIHVAKAAHVRSHLKVPVGVVGKINRPQVAEEILMEDKADFILMGRALLADPFLPHKTSTDRLPDIRPCINCLECSVRLFNNNPIACSVNPCAGQEMETKIVAAAKPHKVFVLGGGPAGLEAASVAAARGHQVVLIEKENRLGGQLNLAAKAPFNDSLRTLLVYYADRLKRHGVEVVLNQQFNPQMVADVDSASVIVATGATPEKPFIAGLSAAEVITAWELLADEPEIGRHVVVLGGGLVGCAAAEYLVRQGKQVTIIEQLADLNVHPVLKARRQLQRRLAEVNILYQSKIIKIVDDKMYLECNGLTQILPKPDRIVLATGAESCVPDFGTVTWRDVKYTGDCVQPRKFMHAISEGYQAAMEV